MVKFWQYAVVFTLLISIVNTGAQASTLEENVIEVRGQATVTTQPDHFSLTLTIVKIGRNTSKIRSLVDHESNQILAITKELGIPAKNVNSARVYLRVIKDTASLHVQGIEVHKNLPQQNRGKVFVDATGNNNDKSQRFELSRTFTVVFSTIDEYDKFLNKIIKVGVERISPLSISVADSEKLYQQALAKAIDNAKIKAQQIANRANIKVGKIVYLKEQSTNHYQGRLSAARMYSEASSDHSSQVTDEAISASVLVKFAIKE